jgi:2-iminobutanoate/2-iminopropanoate deaminase
MKKTFMTKKGPRSVGPYSTAVIYRDTVYISGMGPMDPETNQLVKGSLAEEAHRAFKNVQIILEELGGSLNDALKVTLYLDDINDFKEVNDIYKEYFGPDYPARTTIQAGKLPLGIKVEVDVIAAYKGDPYSY